MTPETVYLVQKNSSWRGVGTGVTVGVVGVLLYFLIKNLGLGGRGGTRDEAPAMLPMPKDAQRLLFVMTQPTFDEPSRPMSFRGPGARPFALEELIARVRAGGRSDVALKITGNVREGSASSASALIKQVGIEVWRDDVRVSGNDRGSYA